MHAACVLVIPSSCLLALPHSYQGARGSHRHTNLDTYSISAGKISGTHGGEKREQELPPRSAGIALTVNPVCTEELVHLLEEVGYVRPSAFEAAIAQSGRPLAL